MVAQSPTSEIAALFRRLSLGVYVVGVSHGGRQDAFTAAWVMQASFDPPLLALSVNPHNASYPLMRAAGAFAVSVLKRGQIDLARRLGTRSGRDEDKLAAVRWNPAQSGAPVLSESLAYLDCDLLESFAAGDHEIVVARVVGGRILDPDAVPMTYAETGDMDGSSAFYRA